MVMRVVRRKIRSAIGRFNKLDFVQFAIRGRILPFRVRRVAGPDSFDAGPDDVVVISVMRNGRKYLMPFLRHHRALGITKFVILDNGSTDGSIEFLSKQPDVTLLQTDAPYHAYENTMKRYLAERFCRNAWCLCVDVDELFEFPRSAQMKLTDLIGYLNERKFNAVITQMLDMFSDAPLKNSTLNPASDLVDQFPFYDLSWIKKTIYTFGEVSDWSLMMHHGGVRWMIFGTWNGLTKVSLFRMDGKIKPFVYWHHTKNARLADISCVLLHFPFVDSFYAKVMEAVESGRYGHLTTGEYNSYAARLLKDPDLSMRGSDARRLQSIDELVDADFLVESADYREWALSRSARSEP